MTNSAPHPDPPLEQHPCQDLCAWVPDLRPATPPRLRCEGCGSQWDRSQAWTPIDRDGRVPDAVHAAGQVAGQDTSVTTPGGTSTSS